MAIVINGMTIPNNGNYIKCVNNETTTDIDKVIVKQGNIETVVWEKIKDIILFPNNIDLIDYTWWYNKDEMLVENEDGDYYKEITHTGASGHESIDIYGTTSLTGSALASNASDGFWRAVRDNCPNKVIFIEGHTAWFHLTVDAAFRFNYDLSSFKRMHVVGYSLYTSASYGNIPEPMPIYIGIYALDGQTLFTTTPNEANWDSIGIEYYDENDSPHGTYGIFDKYIDISNFTGINDIRVGVHCNMGTGSWASSQMIIKTIEFLQ